ncbi:MAG: hypothetical protein RL698_568 [Pseudomonadota bacterium]
MTDEELEAKIKGITFWGSKKSMTIEDVVMVQPGLAQIMPEIGARTWKLFYAAKAQNWPMAKFQYKEIKGLMELGAFMRPKHEDALNQYVAEDWKPLEASIEAKDFAAFEKAFHHAVDQANAYHDLKEKPYIRWKLPDSPPPDLDLTPRGAAKK